MASDAEAFFRRWGFLGVLVGRFFGPLRSVVPLAAGICAMRALPFQVANVGSALTWATGNSWPGSHCPEMVLVDVSSALPSRRR